MYRFIDSIYSLLIYLFTFSYLKLQPRLGDTVIYQTWNVSAMKEINIPRLLLIARTVTKATAVWHKAHLLAVMHRNLRTESKNEWEKHGERMEKGSFLSFFPVNVVCLECVYMKATW